MKYEDFKAGLELDQLINIATGEQERLFELKAVEDEEDYNWQYPTPSSEIGDAIEALQKVFGARWVIVNAMDAGYFVFPWNKIPEGFFDDAYTHGSRGDETLELAICRAIAEHKGLLSAE